jgi:hypothetical protein
VCSSFPVLMIHFITTISSPTVDNEFHYSVFINSQPTYAYVVRETTRCLLGRDCLSQNKSKHVRHLIVLLIKVTHHCYTGLPLGKTGSVPSCWNHVITFAYSLWTWLSVEVKVEWKPGLEHTVTVS